MPFINRNQEVYPYIVVLKRKHQYAFWVLSLFISSLFLFYLIWKAITTPDWVIFTLINLAFSGMLIAHILQYRKKKKKDMSILYITALAALILLPIIFGIAFIVIAYLGYLATRPEEIGFGEDKIVVKKLFSRTIQWDELNNALIKDGLLTLDFKNNKLFQAETDDDDENEDYDVSEDEFNAYCKAHLKP